MDAPAPTPASTPPARRAPPVHAAELFCESCGEVTAHKILRLDPTSLSASSTLQGLARCRQCSLTHRFRSEPDRTCSITEILSKGPRSTASTVDLPARQRLQVGSNVAGLPHRIHRIERKNGRSVSEARAEDVATVWVTSTRWARVPVSVVEGRRTRAVALELAPTQLLEIGGIVRIEDRPYQIRAMRARGQTWHDLGRVFPARDVARVYAARTVSPPAGSSDWSRDRESPSASASSISRGARSRSSPGVSTNRARPRVRIAAGGPTHQSVRR